jgi:hypothetical protein
MIVIPPDDEEELRERRNRMRPTGMMASGVRRADPPQSQVQPSPPRRRAQPDMPDPPVLHLYDLPPRFVSVARFLPPMMVTMLRTLPPEISHQLEPPDNLVRYAAQF